VESGRWDGTYVQKNVPIRQLIGNAAAKQSPHERPDAGNAADGAEERGYQDGVLMELMEIMIALKTRKKMLITP
jgi:hypothetical protein